MLIKILSIRFPFTGYIMWNLKCSFSHSLSFNSLMIFREVVTESLKEALICIRYTLTEKVAVQTTYKKLGEVSVSNR